MLATPALRSLVSYASDAKNKLKENISKIHDNVNGTTAKITKEEEKNQNFKIALNKKYKNIKIRNFKWTMLHMSLF